MPAINAQEIRRRYELEGAAKTVAHLKEALDEGHLKSSDFSIRDLAESLIPDGREWVRSLNPNGGFHVAEDAVDSTAFSNITGQVLYNRILEGFMSEAFVCSALVDTIPTKFNGEKIPGVAKLADDAEIVNEGMPFPTRGFGEDYIETPATTKRGEIVAVTKEAIFFDRTHLIMGRAGEVGQALGINKEKRIADVVVGAVNPFSWKGTTYSTYVSTPWDNTITDELVDWTDVDSAETMFADMLDPNTSEPILLSSTGMTLLTTPAYDNRGRMILSATEVRGEDAAATRPVTQLNANPLRSKGYRHVSSRFAYRRIINSGVAAADAKKYWFLGDFKKAFAYMENWGITVVQAPKNSEAEFTSDIVLRFRASERGAAAVLNPRFVVQSIGTT
jgi:hypothetical protein